MTSRRRSPQELAQSLEYFRENLARTRDEQSLAVWQSQIDAMEVWLASAEYQSGDYAEGIDALMLDLMEWRAMVFAFEEIETEAQPFNKYTFFAQWGVGAVYAIFSLLGKLNSKDTRDNSLRNLWEVISRFIASDNACEPDELAEIERRLHPKQGQFTNAQSKAIKFRNTAIAHNEKSIELTWEEVDKDIQTFARIWSLIVSWSSFGILTPFRSSDVAFAGLEHFFSGTELRALKHKREEYIGRVHTWCRTYLHNGQPDAGRGPFTTINVTSRVIGE